MRVGYLRVSTGHQNADRQLDGIDVEKIFTDWASGEKHHSPETRRADRVRP
ncbi:hypothetical protein ACFQZZ_02485 [Nocardia sp. GCM10030253]|uniref:hypothetical protein n=1 Tax=Nocardia sp. GCM10030253 TaxID=3273404 RepID=UPI00362670E5